MEYIELLRNPFWQRKSASIKDRDGWACRRCHDTFTNLQVHHLYYTNGLMPWEYPDDSLITLCELCHKKAEFIKWLYRFGLAALVRLGLTLEDQHEVLQLIARRVQNNFYKQDVERYMSDIKLQLNG